LHRAEPARLDVRHTQPAQAWTELHDQRAPVVRLQRRAFEFIDQQQQACRLRLQRIGDRLPVAEGVLARVGPRDMYLQLASLTAQPDVEVAHGRALAPQARRAQPPTCCGSNAQRLYKPTVLAPDPTPIAAALPLPPTPPRQPPTLTRHSPD